MRASSEPAYPVTLMMPTRVLDIAISASLVLDDFGMD